MMGERPKPVDDHKMKQAITENTSDENILQLVISTVGYASGKNSTKLLIETAVCTYEINHPCTENVRFILFSGKNRSESTHLNATNNEPPAFYDRNLPLKIVIHGFGSGRFVYKVIRAYLKKGGYNVLFVDWEPLSKKPCYLSAKINTWQVGRCTSEAINQLLPVSFLHIIGFSLGAHIAGILSNILYQKSGQKANRITGLDPALPLYATPIGSLKLDPSDADFVDVIHTSVGTFGKVEPSGHQDFYVNDYPTQPGCHIGSYSVVCSHIRSAEVFAESILTEVGFWATSCYSIWYYIIGICVESPSNEQKVLMGEYTDERYSGIFYVKTADSPPYALGKRQII